MSPAAVEPPTDPAGVAPRARVRPGLGDLDPRTAGALEIVRGAGTSGVVGLVLYQLLAGDLQEVRSDVAGLRGQLTSDVAGVRTELQALRVDVTRLQEQVRPRQGGATP